jgi:hypothetical protein
VLQLVVYAGLQVPVGVALDRLGLAPHGAARRADHRRRADVLAFADDVPTAVLARVLVGRRATP